LKGYIKRYDYFRVVDLNSMNCSCSKYYKNGNCKHIVAAHYVRKPDELPVALDDRVVLSKGRPKGRPKKNPAPLTR
jgi:uncharacterized Zn finger protein